MAERKPPLPDLAALHLRHPGFYEPLCRAYADAASLCLDDSHRSPVDFEVSTGDELSLREVSWSSPSPAARASWSHRDDATEQGACSLGLATVEAELGWVALSRADTRTGADYFVGLPGEDLEHARRLEISGTRQGEERHLQARFREKVEQARRGRSELPALACVVGFRAKRVLLGRVENDA